MLAKKLPILTPEHAQNYFKWAQEHKDCAISVSSNEFLNVDNVCGHGEVYRSAGPASHMRFDLFCPKLSSLFVRWRGGFPLFLGGIFFQHSRFAFLTVR
jgi:hypothetical protein